MSSNKVYGDLPQIRIEEHETRYVAPDYPERLRRGPAARLPRPLRLLQGRRRPVPRRLRPHVRPAHREPAPVLGLRTAPAPALRPGLGRPPRRGGPGRPHHPAQRRRQAGARPAARDRPRPAVRRPRGHRAARRRPPGQRRRRGRPTRCRSSSSSPGSRIAPAPRCAFETGPDPAQRPDGLRLRQRDRRGTDGVEPLRRSRYPTRRAPGSREQCPPSIDTGLGALLGGARPSGESHPARRPLPSGPRS